MTLIGLIILAYFLTSIRQELHVPYSQTLKYLFISGIFFISGLLIHSDQIIQSFKDWRVHVTIQSISFGLFPLVVLIMVNLLNVDEKYQAFSIGFILLACVPTTITSCVVMTRLAQGNEANALFNAAFGNLLGIFITPLLILLIFKTSVEIDVLPVIRKLLLLVLLPLSIGQLIQWLISEIRHQKLLALISNWLLLMLLFIIFINAFILGIRASTVEIMLVLLSALFLRLLMLKFAWIIANSKHLNFDLSNQKCILITSSQKTLALGLPLLTLLFPDHREIVLISLPLIFYHLIQLLIDSLIAQRLAQDNANK